MILALQFVSRQLAHIEAQGLPEMYSRIESDSTANSNYGLAAASVRILTLILSISSSCLSAGGADFALLGRVDGTVENLFAAGVAQVEILMSVADRDEQLLHVVAESGHKAGDKWSAAQRAAVICCTGPPKSPSGLANTVTGPIGLFGLKAPCCV